MKKVKKYSTFDELKNSYIKTSNGAMALKKHSDFEKLMKEIVFLNSKNHNSSMINQ